MTDSPKTQPRYVTSAVAAQMLGVSPSAIVWLVARGRLSFIELQAAHSIQRIFLRTDVDALLAARGAKGPRHRSYGDYGPTATDAPHTSPQG